MLILLRKILSKEGGGGYFRKSHPQFLFLDFLQKLKEMRMIEESQ